MREIAQLTDKYQTMTRAHLKGAQDGNQNLPPSNEQRLSQTELEIVQLAQDDVNEYTAKQKDENDSTSEKFRAWEGALPDEFHHTIEAFKTRIGLKFGEAERELLRLYGTVLARRQEYRYFKTVNRLNRDTDVPSSFPVAVSWLIFIIVVDGAANSFFFKDTNPHGLVGGFLLAGAISVVNTMTGFATGLVPWRYLQHRNRLHVIWAFPLLIIMFVVIGILNLAVGHYRDLLATNKAADAEQVLAKLLASPFELHSLQSMLLVGIGIGIAMFAARKGYTLFDTYPGYGRYYKRREEAQDKFDERIKTTQTSLDEVAQSFLSDIKSQYRRSTKMTQDCASAVDDSITRNKAYEEWVAGVQEACNAAIRTYRDANMQVRDMSRYPPPGYFSKQISLTIRKAESDLQQLDSMKMEIAATTTRLKTDYEKLCQSVPEHVRQFLSESALNDRLESIKERAKQAQREDNQVNSQ